MDATIAQIALRGLVVYLVVGFLITIGTLIYEIVTAKTRNQVMDAFSFDLIIIFVAWPFMLLVGFFMALGNVLGWIKDMVIDAILRAKGL